MPENIEEAWHWTDIVSTYRYWALVFSGFLVAGSWVSVNVFLSVALRDQGLDMTQIGIIHSMSMFGAFFGILLMVYFLRTRLKFALILIAAITGLAACLLFLKGNETPLFAGFLAFLVRMGNVTFAMAVVLTLVSARPNVKSFILVYSVVLIWSLLSQFFAPPLIGFIYNANPEILWIVGLPAILAALILLPANGSMFAEAPNTQIVSEPPKKREPLLVFLCAAFIPFYYLFWIFHRSTETKFLTPDIPQPSRGGALCLALFAGFIIPVWLHDVRKAMGKRIGHRSAALLGLLSFFIAPLGAALAQSDNNLIKDSNSNQELS